MVTVMAMAAATVRAMATAAADPGDDQPMCLCTSSTLDGPGSASPIHGPGIDGSMMPSSSHV